MLAELYAGMDAPLIRTTVETAEMVKYVNNAFHALKGDFSTILENDIYSGTTVTIVLPAEASCLPFDVYG